MPVPWLTPSKPQSEVHKLIADELDEDSSGDEYIPDLDDVSFRTLKKPSRLYVCLEYRIARTIETAR